MATKRFLVLTAFILGVMLILGATPPKDDVITSPSCSTYNNRTNGTCCVAFTNGNACLGNPTSDRTSSNCGCCDAPNTNTDAVYCTLNGAVYYTLTSYCSSSTACTGTATTCPAACSQGGGGS